MLLTCLGQEKIDLAIDYEAKKKHWESPTGRFACILLNISNNWLVLGLPPPIVLLLASSSSRSSSRRKENW